MKRTSNGKWAHMMCAVYTPRATFLEPYGMSCIGMLDDCGRRVGLNDTLQKASATAPCQICTNQTGLVVRCAFSNCKAVFHARCAYLRNQLLFCSGTDPLSGRLSFSCLCEEHSAEAYKSAKQGVCAPTSQQKTAIAQSSESAPRGHQISRKRAASSMLSSHGSSVPRPKLLERLGLVSDDPRLSGFSIRTLKPIKDQPVSEMDRRIFMQDLRAFHRRLGTSVRLHRKEVNVMQRLPQLGHAQVDLYLLFKWVLSYGGFEHVKSFEGTWGKIYRSMPNYSSTETSASYRLRRIYERYLEQFEVYYYPHLAASPAPDLCYVGGNRPKKVHSLSQFKKTPKPTAGKQKGKQNSRKLDQPENNVLKHSLLAAAAGSFNNADNEKQRSGSDALFQLSSTFSLAASKEKPSGPSRPTVEKDYIDGFCINSIG